MPKASSHNDVDRSRVPGPEVEPTEIDKHELQLATDAAAALDKALRARKTYPASHPAILPLQNRAFTTLESYLGAHGLLELEVSPFALLLRGHPVLEMQDRQQGCFYCAFLDGVCALRFLPGTRREELESLCEALLFRLNHPEDPEDDLVTRLWRARLEHIMPVVADSFVDLVTREDLEESEKRSERVDSIVRAAKSRVRLPTMAQSQPRAAPLSLKEIESLEQVAYFWAYELNPERLTELVKHGNTPSELDQRYAEILYRMEADRQRSSASQDEPRSLSHLQEIFLRSVNDGELRHMAHLLDRLRAIPVATDTTFAELVGWLAAPERLKLLFDLTESRARHSASSQGTPLGDAPSALATYVVHLPTSALAELVTRLRHTRDETLKDLYVRALSGVIPSVSSDGRKLLLGLLAERDVALVSALIDAFAAAGQAKATLGAAEHPDARVRQHVLTKAASLPLEDLTPTVLARLDDSDAGVRALAWRQGQNLPSGDALVSRLRQCLGAPISDRFSEDELGAGYTWLGRVGGEDMIEELTRALAGQGTLARPRGKRTRLLVMALAATSAPLAIDTLLREAKQHFRWSRLSRLCREVARDMLVAQRGGA
jgi:hypothetical protein